MASASETTPLIGTATDDKRSLQNTVAAALGGGALRRSNTGEQTRKMFEAGKDFDLPVQYDDIVTSFVPRPSTAASRRSTVAGDANTHVGTTTIFNAAIEESLDQSTKEWLMSVVGVMLQFSVCAFFTIISVYDAVFKKKAVTLSKPPHNLYSEFNISSLIIWASLLSVILGMLLTWWKGQMSIFWEEGSLKMLLVYGPIGSIFAFTNFLGIVILMYLPPDILNVLDQSRLLLMGLLSWVILGKGQSRMSWLMLGSIMFAAVAYTFVRSGVEVSTKHEDLLSFAHGLPSLAKYGLPDLSGAMYPMDVFECGGLPCPGKLTGLFNNDTTLRQMALKEELTGRINVAVKGHSLGGGGASDNFIKGCLLTLVFMTLQSFGGIYHEVMLKQYKHVPFYTQKVYQEFWGFLFGILNTAAVAPFLASKGIGSVPLAETSFFNNPLAGWESPWVRFTFATFMVRSWCIVIILRILDSMTKQLCAVCTTGLIYFFMLMHSCNGHANGNDFWCPDGFQDMSFKVAIADFGVLFAVICYAMLQVEQKKWQAIATKTEKVQTGQP